MENEVRKTLGNFGFEDDIYGLSFVVEREPLSPGCLTEGEIDANRARLKDGIDAAAERMKRALRNRSSIVF